MRLVKFLSFSAAHYLENYDGKCANLHGHTWMVQVKIDWDTFYSFAHNVNNGMLVDFSLIKDRIINRFDHTTLNDVIKINPTAENLSAIMCLDLMLSIRFDVNTIIIVRLFESATSYIEINNTQAIYWLDVPIKDAEKSSDKIKILTKFMGEKIWK